MANKLHRTIRPGEIVVIDRQLLKPEYQDKDRRVVVIGSNFGNFAFTSGSMLACHELSDDSECRWEGDTDLNVDETNAAWADAENDSQYGWLFKVIKLLHSQLDQVEKIRDDWWDKAKAAETELVEVKTKLWRATRPRVREVVVHNSHKKGSYITVFRSGIEYGWRWTHRDTDEGRRTFKWITDQLDEMNLHYAINNAPDWHSKTYFVPRPADQE